MTMAHAFGEGGEKDTSVDNQKEHQIEKKTLQSDGDTQQRSNQVEDIDTTDHSDEVDLKETSQSVKVQENELSDVKKLVRAVDLQNTFEQPSNQVENEVDRTTELRLSNAVTVHEQTNISSMECMDHHDKQAVRALLEGMVIKVVQGNVAQVSIEAIRQSSNKIAHMIGQNNNSTNNSPEDTPSTKQKMHDTDSKSKIITESTPASSWKSEKASTEANGIHTQHQSSSQSTTPSPHSRSKASKSQVRPLIKSKVPTQAQKAPIGYRPPAGSNANKHTHASAHISKRCADTDQQSVRTSISKKKPAKDPKADTNGYKGTAVVTERSLRQTHGRYANVESRVKQMIESESQRNTFDESVVRDCTPKESVGSKKSTSATKLTTSRNRFTSVTPRYLNYTASPVFYKNMQTQYERRKRLEEVNAAKSQERQQAIQKLLAQRKQEEIEETEEELRRGRDLHEYTTSVKSAAHSNGIKNAVSKRSNRLADV